MTRHLHEEYRDQMVAFDELALLISRVLGDHAISTECHLVANLLVFHNIVTLSRALNRLQSDDLKASDQALAVLTPYQTEHINRFGNYTVNFSRTPEPLPPALCKSAGS